nr:MAG TPA: hypothetical protein [Caudoviricetes sp.]
MDCAACCVGKGVNPVSLILSHPPVPYTVCIWCSYYF